LITGYSNNSEKNSALEKAEAIILFKARSKILGFLLIANDPPFPFIDYASCHCKFLSPNRVLLVWAEILSCFLDKFEL
jgi:hypothetical protein